MASLIFGIILLAAGMFLFSSGARLNPNNVDSRGLVIRVASGLLAGIGAITLVGSTIKVIDAGQVGVQHAFGRVNPNPLLPGIRIVWPWSYVERYSTREEQFPPAGDRAEDMPALSSEQMAMQVDVAVRWQIDPMQAPKIFTEIGAEAQIEAVVMNAIRNGVRDGMARFSINQIAERGRISSTMSAEVDSALVTRPRAGGEPFRIASVTAFFLRNLQPPAQVVNAINAKIAQEQQIQTEKHRVEVARLQSEQQKLLNQTLTPEALMKQYLEVLHDMRTSNNLVVLVPTEGGAPLLDLNALRRNIRQP
jgi:regulator of protease activity HflC (stomatin/prohibitin superfamily)